ncbi:MAG: hypothetical protein ACFB3T_03050 [Geminicoccaceae bacterium]
MDPGWPRILLAVVQARWTNAGFPSVYGPFDQPRGVRRFFGRDRIGRLANRLQPGSGA